MGLWLDINAGSPGALDVKLDNPSVAPILAMTPAASPDYEAIQSSDTETRTMTGAEHQHGASKAGSQVVEMLPLSADSAWPTHSQRESEAAAEYEGGEKARLGKMERLQETWVWEVLAIVWALACLAAIIIILAFISDKSISSWKAPIGPNTLVAVFSALSKAALMTTVPACISQLKWIHFSKSPKPLIDMQTFDEASRGPFGSVLFFYDLAFAKSRSKASALASIGCIITIMVLALEPFTQQIISFRNRDVELGNGQGIAELTVADGYDTGATTKGGGWRQEVTDDAMQGAILAGIFSQTIDTKAYEKCSTSNCSWPIASSLSICSTCQDVSASSTKNCTENKYGANVQPLTCNYTTPARNFLQAETGPSSSASRFYTLVDAAMGTAGINANGGAAMIASIGILRTGDSKNSSVYKDIYKAHIDECHLYWCKSTYTQNAIFANGLRNLEVTTELLSWDQQQSKTAVMIDKANETSYSVNLIDFSGLGIMLNSLFTTSLSSEQYSDAVNTNFSIGSWLYKADSISSLLERTAASMSARLRSGDKVSKIDGKVMHNETYIHVNWAWITLPVVVFIASIMFMAFTVWANAREQGWLWRSSVLPFMFVGRAWGVDEAATSGAGGGSVSGMERVSAKNNVLCNEFVKRRGYSDTESSNEAHGRPLQ